MLEFRQNTQMKANAGMQVRRLLCLCTAQLYVVGDSVPMYTTVSSLQDLLSAKEAKGLDKLVHLAGLQCLAILCEKHGQKLASSMLETLTIAAKYASR